MVEISMQHEIVFWADQMEWIPILQSNDDVSFL